MQKSRSVNTTPFSPSDLDSSEADQVSSPTNNAVNIFVAVRIRPLMENGSSKDIACCESLGDSFISLRREGKPYPLLFPFSTVPVGDVRMGECFSESVVSYNITVTCTLVIESSHPTCPPHTPSVLSFSNPLCPCYFASPILASFPTAMVSACVSCTSCFLDGVYQRGSEPPFGQHRVAVVYPLTLLYFHCAHQCPLSPLSAFPNTFHLPPSVRLCEMEWCTLLGECRCASNHSWLLTSPPLLHLARAQPPDEPFASSLPCLLFCHSRPLPAVLVFSDR